MTEKVTINPLWGEDSQVEGWHVRVQISAGLHANNAFFVGNGVKPQQAYLRAAAWAEEQLRNKSLQGKD